MEWKDAPGYVLQQVHVYRTAAGVSFPRALWFVLTKYYPEFTDDQRIELLTEVPRMDGYRSSAIAHWMPSPFPKRRQYSETTRFVFAVAPAPAGVARRLIKRFARNNGDLKRQREERRQREKESAERQGNLL